MALAQIVKVVAGLRSSFEMLFEHNPDAVMLINSDGLILDANPGAVRIYGYTRQELASLTFYDLREPISRPLLRKQLEQALDQSIAYAAIHVKKDGSFFPVAINAYRTTIHAKPVIMTFIREISPSKQMEEHLKQSQDYCAKLFDDFVVMLWRTDSQGNCDFVNKRLLEFTGRDITQVMQQGWSNSIHPGDLDTLFLEFCRAFSEKRSFEVEYRLRRFDGIYRWLVCVGGPFFDSDGNFAGFQGFSYDIHNKKKTEQELKWSEEKFRQVFHNTNDLMFLLEFREDGLPGQYIEVNEAGCQLLGHSREELLLLTPQELLTGGGPWIKLWPAVQEQLVFSGNASFEINYLTREGVTIPLEMKARLLKIQNQKAVLLVAQDISVWKVTQKALQEEARRMSLETELKSMELKALQSQVNPHFLFNALNTIARLAMFEGAEKTEQVVYALANLMRCSLRRIEEVVTVGEEIEYIRQYLLIQQLRFSRIKSCIDVPDSSMPFKLPIMTLQPLVENAIMHGLESKAEGGTIFINTWQSADGLMVEIRDDGIGIPQDVVNELNQGCFSCRQGRDHTGVGLKNVISRLQLYFGSGFTYKISSQVGRGTKVLLLLPRE